MLLNIICNNGDLNVVYILIKVGIIVNLIY